MNKKSKGFSLLWVLLIAILTSIVSGLTTGVIVYNNKFTNKVIAADLSSDNELNEFLDVYSNIVTKYYEDINKDEMLEKAISAMIEYLGDDYTSYLNDSDTNELLTKLSGKYTGIGISINNSDKSIIKVYDDTPAKKAGILEGDIIIGFNDIDVTSMTTNEVVDLIKNTNEYFSLKLQRKESVIDISLKSEEILNATIS